MDPISALGLAGNLVTFIEFTGKLLREGRELYQSADGASASHKTLEEVTSDLKSLCASLTASSSVTSDSGLSFSGRALLPLLESCKGLGHELLTTLEGLKVSGQRKIWKSARQALRCAWKTNEIDSYKQQLDLYRSQLATRLLSLLL